jgi:Metallo-beta-lactamase superfamily
MQFDNPNLKTPPNKDEIEVTLIGPGFGEAILVHLGDFKWVLIDSCVSQIDSRSVPLSYLRYLNQDTKDVVAIVSTHWDDDHIRGISQLVDNCSNAKFFTAHVLQNRDFLKFAFNFDNPLVSKFQSGVSEILRSIECAQQNRLLSYASSDKCLFQEGTVLLDHRQPFCMWSFSPSDEEHTKFLRWVASMLPSNGVTRKIPIARRRNDLSVVIFISIGADAILLGADLEEENNPLTGWSAILSSSGRPKRKSSLFKIAHHGSLNGHHEGQWTSLLEKDSFAVVAPWKLAGRILPSDSDRERIRSLTPNAFLSASTSPPSIFKRPSAVRKTINEVAKRFESVADQPGIVRCRKRAGEIGSWTVELFGSAQKM